MILLGWLSLSEDAILLQEPPLADNSKQEEVLNDSATRVKELEVIARPIGF